ncbi:transthyretin-like family protein [Schlesneria paludicola]|uniref:hypothetical protein n=1 Tax=Schlesneria paludicola TaxID=360056 RepID=UPI00029AA5A0|nr:hypothetical protein [Schlesneria paludicola]
MIPRFQTAFVLASGLITLTADVGCQRAKPLKLAAAAGVVTINGQPAENILVQFYPDLTSGPNSPTSSGVSDESGFFTLKTSDGRNGAVVGTCKVVLVDLEEVRPTDQGQINQVRQRLPPRYNVARPDGLSVNVSDESDPITIDIKS